MFVKLNRTELSNKGFELTINPHAVTEEQVEFVLSYVGDVDGVNRPVINMKNLERHAEKVGLEQPDIDLLTDEIHNLVDQHFIRKAIFS